MSQQQPKAQLPMVENISCILPETQTEGGLFLGNYYGAKNPKVLQAYGIRSVLTTSIQTQVSYNPEDIPLHFRIEAHDKEDYSLIEHINPCIAFIEKSRKHTNTYVHCFAGVSRSAAIVCAYLMWKFKWGVDRCLKFMVYKRIVVKPNDGFMNQLRDVEKRLNIKGRAESNLSGSSAGGNQVGKRVHSVNGHENNQPLPRQQSNASRGSFQSNPYILPQTPTMPQTPTLPQKAIIPQTSTQQNVKNMSQFNPKKEKISLASQITYQNQQKNHTNTPIPKILSKKSSNLQQQSYTNRKPTSRKHLFDNHLSPDVMPNSPRMASTTNNFFSSNTFKNNSTSFNRDSQADDYYGYTKNLQQTNHKTSNASSIRSKFQNSQKSKTTSRCIIRPKDLPGYKNY